jgi:DNA-binding XRE family transcriptional regulator
MANKEKTIIPNKLLKIREELGYSQKEIGEI